MPQYCCVPLCTYFGGHRFPTESKLRDKWRVAVTRVNDCGRLGNVRRTSETRPDFTLTLLGQNEHIPKVPNLCYVFFACYMFLGFIYSLMSSDVLFWRLLDSRCFVRSIFPSLHPHLIFLLVRLFLPLLFLLPLCILSFPLLIPSHSPLHMLRGVFFYTFLSFSFSLISPSLLLQSRQVFAARGSSWQAFCMLIKAGEQTVIYLNCFSYVDTVLQHVTPVLRM